MGVSRFRSSEPVTVSSLVYLGITCEADASAPLELALADDSVPPGLGTLVWLNTRRVAHGEFAPFELASWYSCMRGSMGGVILSLDLARVVRDPEAEGAASARLAPK